MLNKLATLGDTSKVLCLLVTHLPPCGRRLPLAESVSSCSFRDAFVDSRDNRLIVGRPSRGQKATATPFTASIPVDEPYVIASGLALQASGLLYPASVERIPRGYYPHY